MFITQEVTTVGVGVGNGRLPWQGAAWAGIAWQRGLIQ